ncbi:hypothetical protein [Enemella sp. A6]|uniref:hypothetical protein n=1 Tax=Enemella sp. A6 TaxID=3440152 RepID=UPI003EBBD97F
MPDLSFDLDELSTGADAVRTVADQAATDASALSAVVEASAMCWGVDEPGRAFASAYLEPATETMTAALQVGAQLAAIAENIDRMRLVYAEGEQNGVDLSQEIQT